MQREIISFSPLSTRINKSSLSFIFCKTLCYSRDECHESFLRDLPSERAVESLKACEASLREPSQAFTISAALNLQPLDLRAFTYKCSASYQSAALLRDFTILAILFLYLKLL